MIIKSKKVALGMPDEPLVYCPGCKILHKFSVTKPNMVGAQWTFNWDFEKPTFSPSLVIYNEGRKGVQCHSFLKNGIWQFLSDSSHKLAGKYVPLPDLPNWVR